MANLPRFILIKPLPLDPVFDSIDHHQTYARYERGTRTGHVYCNGKDVFDPFVKIEVEKSNTNEMYCHLRFCQSNRYWGRCASGMRTVAAVSKHAEEDTSTPSCTLFQPIINEGCPLKLIHVQSKMYVSADPDTCRLLLGGRYVGWPSTDPVHKGNAFTFVDFDSHVRLPPRVAFKGENNLFLIGEHLIEYTGEHPEGYMQLRFSESDVNNGESAHEVMTQPDGSVRIKSAQLNRFWRRDDSTNRILVDSYVWRDVETQFIPVKVNDIKIALKCAVNQMFCCPGSREYSSAGSIRNFTDCIRGAASERSPETWLEILEPVAERKIYRVTYQMEDALVSGEERYEAGDAFNTNPSNTPVILTLNVSKKVVTSYTFTRSFSLEERVETTFKAGKPYIAAQGHIEVSPEFTVTMTWGIAKEEKKQVEGSFSIKAPPMSRVTAKYVGTKGTCSVPFTYFQKDKSSDYGKYYTSENTDGIFKCEDYHSFRFEEVKIEHL